MVQEDLNIEEDISLDDEVFSKYKNQRMKELLNNMEEIEDETELIKKTHSETMIVHFYNESFSMCKIMDKELNKIVKMFDNIKFYKVKADICPIVVFKLKIEVLPFLGFFKEGYFVDQVVGFEGMGEDRFIPERLLKRIKESNIFKPVSFIE